MEFRFLMSDKFKNKYSTESMRLQGWDYGSNGGYFITICTKNREHFFGEKMCPTFLMNLLLNPEVNLPVIKTQC